MRPTRRVCAVVMSPLLPVANRTAPRDAKKSAAVVELFREAKARGAAIVGIFHAETVREQVADRLHPMGVSS
ncbi:ribophosphonate triphosphate synthase subunit [Escherichia coli]|nr:ribophosphonate triphosphate synthase subunit [Escherichia coli]